MIIVTIIWRWAFVLTTRLYTNDNTNDGIEDDDNNSSNNTNSNNGNDADIPKVIKPDFDNLFARMPTLDDILKPPATPTSTDNTRRSSLESGVDGRGAAN